MAIRDLINKIPELAELVTQIRFEIQQAKRPANEIIYDDVDLREISKGFQKDNRILAGKRLDYIF